MRLLKYGIKGLILQLWYSDFYSSFQPLFNYNDLNDNLKLFFKVLLQQKVNNPGFDWKDNFDIKGRLLFGNDYESIINDYINNHSLDNNGEIINSINGNPLTTILTPLQLSEYLGDPGSGKLPKGFKSTLTNIPELDPLDTLKQQLYKTLSDASSVDQSNTWLDLGKLLGLGFSGVNFDLGDNFKNVNLGKIITNTAGGVLTTINAIKNINSINKSVNDLKNSAIEAAQKTGKSTEEAVKNATKDISGISNAKAGNAMAIAGAASGIADSFLGDRQEYDGDYGNITRTIDNVYDGISDAAMSMGPIGMFVGGAMKTADLFGDVMGKLGGGTDGMTDIDSVLGSSLFSWNFGLINGFGGKTTDTIKKDKETFAQIGSSYLGTNLLVNDALHKSGKKYGLFSRDAYKKAQNTISEAKRQLGLMQNIASEARSRFDLKNSMSAFNAERYNYLLNGGYQQGNIRVGKHGMLLLRAKEILKPKFFIEELEISELQSFKYGGIIETFVEELQVPTYIEELNIEIFKEGGKTSEQEWSEDPIEYAIQRFPILASLPQISLLYDPNFTPKEIGDYGDIEYISAEHDTLPYYHNYRKLKQYRGLSTIVYNDDVNNEDIALDWLTHGLRERNLSWQYYLKFLELDPTWKEAIDKELFGSFLYSKGIEPRKYRGLSKSKKDKLENEFKNTEIDQETYNSIIDGLIRGILVLPNNRESYGGEETYNNFFKPLKNTEIWKEIENFIFKNVDKYRLGGKVNVIPEGALHARLHHIENDENITKKGIPVVDNEGEQQAEIEVNEIIYRLEVTKRLEELCKEYYSENCTLKRKDELAIEAGKILVYETLYNTLDNTNLINEIK